MAKPRLQNRLVWACLDKARVFYSFFVLSGLLTLSTGLFAATVTIGVIGDYGAVGYSPMYAVYEGDVARLVKSWQPDFIVTTGDNNYPSGAAGTMDLNVGQFYHEYIYPYSGVYGEGAASNRFFPVLGNHDYFSSITAQPYLDYFTLPGNERYYTYLYGNVEIFAVNSEYFEPDGRTADSVQGQWLRSALAASQARWRLVFFHTPPYNSGVLHGDQTGEGAHMRWPFKEWGATAVFSGHSHFYERIITNGMVYFVNGAGGAPLYEFTNPRIPGSVVAFNSDWGAQRIVATETNLAIEFFTRSNILVDSYVIWLPPPNLAIHHTPNGFEILVTGEPGVTYAIEASEDLSNWVEILPNLTLSNRTAIFSHQDSGQQWQFFRARLVVP